MRSVFNEIHEKNLCRQVQCLYFRNNKFLCIVRYCISAVNIRPVWYLKKKKNLMTRFDSVMPVIIGLAVNKVTME